MPYALTGALRDKRHAQCVQVYELRELEPDWPHWRIAEKVGIHTNAVWRWLYEPDRWFPWIDEICIERALEGDRKAFDALTNWERPAFFERLQAKRRSMDINAWTEWVQLYAGRLGFDGGSVGDRLYQRYGAGFKGRPEKRIPARNQLGQIMIRRKDRYGRRNFL